MYVYIVKHYYYSYEGSFERNIKAFASSLAAEDFATECNLELKRLFDFKNKVVNEKNDIDTWVLLRNTEHRFDPEVHALEINDNQEYRVEHLEFVG